jgi:hypothetical protein
MTEYTERLVDDIRGVLRRAHEGVIPPTDAAKTLEGIASAMDGSVPAEVRAASRQLANEVESLAYGGSAASLAEVSGRFEAAIRPAGSRDIAEL